MSPEVRAQKAKERADEKRQAVSLRVHNVLDAGGMIPAAGAFCDGANGMLYLIEGDLEGVAFSAIAFIPLVGQVSTPAKYLDDGAELAFKYGDDAAEALCHSDDAFRFTIGYSDDPLGLLFKESEANGNLLHYGDDFKGAGNPILKGEGNVGTYKELIDAGKRGDDLTPHNMPSAEYMKNNGVSKNNGISMNMEQPATGGRHRLTDTYGRNMTDAEKANYYSLSLRDALAHDLWNAREIYIQQGKYTSEIRQGLLDVIKRNKSDYPNLFNK